MGKASAVVLKSASEVSEHLPAMRAVSLWHIGHPNDPLGEWLQTPPEELARFQIALVYNLPSGAEPVGNDNVAAVVVLGLLNGRAYALSWTIGGDPGSCIMLFTEGIIAALAAHGMPTDFTRFVRQAGGAVPEGFMPMS